MVNRDNVFFNAVRFKWLIFIMYVLQDDITL